MADKKISQLSAASLPLTGTELVPLVQSGVTKNVPVNQLNIGPSFSAYQSSVQAIGAAFTPTKIQFQTEIWDTANCFDNATNYRFTPNVAGYYQVSGSVAIGSASFITLAVHKNGNLEKNIFNTYPTTVEQGVGSVLVYMNGTTDYIELYVTVNAAMNITASQYYTYFQAALVRNG